LLSSDSGRSLVAELLHEELDSIGIDAGAFDVESMTPEADGGTDEPTASQAQSTTQAPEKVQLETAAESAGGGAVAAGLGIALVLLVGSCISVRLCAEHKSELKDLKIICTAKLDKLGLLGQRSSCAIASPPKESSSSAIASSPPGASMLDSTLENSEAWAVAAEPQGPTSWTPDGSARQGSLLPPPLSPRSPSNVAGLVGPKVPPLARPVPTRAQLPPPSDPPLEAWGEAASSRHYPSPRMGTPPAAGQSEAASQRVHPVPWNLASSLPPLVEQDPELPRDETPAPQETVGIASAPPAEQIVPPSPMDAARPLPSTKPPDLDLPGQPTEQAFDLRAWLSSVSVAMEAKPSPDSLNDQQTGTGTSSASSSSRMSPVPPARLQASEGGETSTSSNPSVIPDASVHSACSVASTMVPVPSATMQLSEQDRSSMLGHSGVASQVVASSPRPGVPFTSPATPATSQLAELDVRSSPSRPRMTPQPVTSSAHSDACVSPAQLPDDETSSTPSHQRSVAEVARGNACVVGASSRSPGTPVLSQSPEWPAGVESRDQTREQTREQTRDLQIEAVSSSSLSAASSQLRSPPPPAQLPDGRVTDQVVVARLRAAKAAAKASANAPAKAPARAPAMAAPTIPAVPSAMAAVMNRWADFGEVEASSQPAYRAPPPPARPQDRWQDPAQRRVGPGSVPPSPSQSSAQGAAQPGHRDPSGNPSDFRQWTRGRQQEQARPKGTRPS